MISLRLMFKHKQTPAVVKPFGAVPGADWDNLCVILMSFIALMDPYTFILFFFFDVMLWIQQRLLYDFLSPGGIPALSPHFRLKVTLDFKQKNRSGEKEEEGGT